MESYGSGHSTWHEWTHAKARNTCRLEDCVSECVPLGTYNVDFDIFIAVNINLCMFIISAVRKSE